MLKSKLVSIIFVISLFEILVKTASIEKKKDPISKSKIPSKIFKLQLQLKLN